MSVSTTSPPGVTPSAGPARWAWLAVGLALTAVGVTYATLRWTGYLPLGSDNDEYLLVGQALARLEAPVVAGVEGTKYPLGYPAVLAVLEWLRLPVAPSALVLNLVAMGVTVGTVAGIVGRSAPAGLPTTRDRTAPVRDAGAALAAGGLLVASAAIWNDVYSVMPDLLLLAVVAGLLATVAQPLSDRRLLLLTALAVVAVLLKTLAVLLVVGGCGVLWLVARRRPEAVGSDGARSARVLVPAGAALVTVLVGMLLMRPYPEHTTGYLATFPLADPDDASQGRLGPGGLVGRVLADVPDTLRDFGRAITLLEADRWLAVAVAVVTLTLGVWGALRLRPRTPFGPFVAGMTVAYAAGMSAWPYNSSRFGFPMVPVAALGVGWLVHRLAPRGPASLVAAGLFLALLVSGSAPMVAERGERSQATLARQHADLDVLAGWVGTEVDEDEQLVSFDYREAARRLDRDVQPIAYTADPDALLAQVEGSDHLVVLDHYRKRTRQVESLLRTHADRFELLLDEGSVRVFAIRP